MMLNLIVIRFQILADPCVSDQRLLFLKKLGVTVCTATMGAVLGGHEPTSGVSMVQSWSEDG